jgi:putative PIN family toxin of toxin-antitoxin system
MIRVVVDTNVVVSALLRAEGNEQRVLRLALAGRFTWLVSQPIAAEYEGVLTRPKFRLAARDVADALHDIRRVVTWIEPRTTLAIADDEAVNRFLECAEAGDADYLVTGNLRHFPATIGRTPIINARRLVEGLMPKP